MALYRAIVAQSRQAGFYREHGVPDSLDGRFDMIVLHSFLVMRRLRRIGAAAEPLSQQLFDLMFADMDSNLREIGVGDLSVGKKVKAMAQAFYG
ncbi:ubiquinol-cytochrome C chaperone family protein, partial [Ferrovibrio sp.]